MRPSVSSSRPMSSPSKPMQRGVVAGGEPRGVSDGAGHVNPAGVPPRSPRCRSRRPRRHPARAPAAGRGLGGQRGAAAGHGDELVEHPSAWVVASRASASGTAKASPTSTSWDTDSRSTRSRRASAAKLSPVNNTTVAPLHSAPQRHPLRGAVHERAGDGHAGGMDLGSSVTASSGVTMLRSSRLSPPSAAKNRSS